MKSALGWFYLFAQNVFFCCITKFIKYNPIHVSTWWAQSYYFLKDLLKNSNDHFNICKNNNLEVRIATQKKSCVQFFFGGGGVQEGIKDLMCKQIYNCFFFNLIFWYLCILPNGTLQIILPILMFFLLQF